MGRQIVRFAGGGRGGSAIVGVLVAMVFMGIVVGAMLRSTGGQAAASMSLGNMLVASSTVGSAVIATGTHLTNENNAVNAAGIVCSLLNNPGYGRDRYLIGRNGKVPIAPSAPNQRFSSRLESVFLVGDDIYAQVDIRSGREAASRDIKKAMVFAGLGGIKAEAVGSNNAWVKNAFFMGKGQLIGDSPITIEGAATFANDPNPSTLLNPNDDGRYTIMNTGAHLMRFTKDSEGRGDVFFNGPADLQANNIAFESNVYFNSQANLRGATSFKSGAGFNANFWTVGNEVLADRDIWMNGRFLSPEGHPDQTRMGQSAGGTGAFHYNKDVFGDLGLVDFPAGSIKEEPAASMATPEVLKKLDNMKPIDERMEDDLVLSVGNKSFRKLSDIISHPVLNWSVSGEKFTEFIRQARTDPAYAENFYPDPATGHFLLEENQGWGWAGGMFDGKVIINVTGQMNVNGNFFNTTENSSTMVYVDKKGKLNNWGPAKNGIFHGLIYVHPDNKEEQVLAGGRFEGAVLLKGGKKMYTPVGAALTIAKNDKVLAPFGAMLKKPNGQLAGEGVPSGSGAVYQTQLLRPDAGIDFRPLGYYYY